MTYDGVADARDRRDLIAYLQQLDASPQCRASGSAAMPAHSADFSGGFKHGQGRAIAHAMLK